MRAWLACAALAWFAGGMPAPALAQADAPLVHVVTLERHEEPGSEHVGHLPAVAADAVWQPATLPAAVRPAAPGRWWRHWYRTRYAYDGGERVAIYLPRVNFGFATGIDVLVDGRRIEDDLYQQGFAAWNSPVFVPIPESVLAHDSPRTVEVLIGIEYEAGSGYLLSDFWIGPRSALGDLRATRLLWASHAPLAISLALLAIGAFAFVVWVRRRTETAYLLFALASAAWFVRTLHYWVPSPPIAEEWFWWLTINSLTWLMVIVYLFAFRFHERRFPRLERALYALVAIAAVATLPGLIGNRIAVSTLAYGVQLAVALGVTLVITRESRGNRTRETQLLALALWANLALGVHDLLLKDWWIVAPHVFLMPYGALAIFGAFLYAVQRRYTGAIASVESANASLESRLAERTRELERSHQRLRAIEREATLADERQRLMRDMHDGLGSALMSSLVMVEQGRLSAGEVARVLRECIDDLKLTIDSLEPIGSDLVTLLATLRYRLGGRLEAAGLKLDWRVSDLPPLPWLDALSALQVLRMLQESLTNVIKHAGARTITVETAAGADCVQVRVGDDGRGFDAAAERAQGSGRGLLNLRRRAAQIGGELRIVSAPGAGTTIELTLPIERRDPTRPDAPPAPEGPVRRRSDPALDA